MLCDTCDKERDGQSRTPRTGMRSSSSARSSTGSSSKATDNMPARETVPTNTAQSVEDNPSALGSSELNTSRADGTDQSPSNEAVPELHCMAQCKHGRLGDGDMIRCCLCFIWHHEDCISTPVSKEDEWWVCPGCRTLSTSISTFTTVVVVMQDILSKSFQINTALVASVDDLKHKNTILTAQVGSLKPVTYADGSPSQQPSSLPKLLIGDSTIRDVACTDPRSLYIVSRGGAKTSDTLQTLRKNEKQYIWGYHCARGHKWLFYKAPDRWNKWQYPFHCVWGKTGDKIGTYHAQ